MCVFVSGCVSVFVPEIDRNFAKAADSYSNLSPGSLQAVSAAITRV